MAELKSRGIIAQVNVRIPAPVDPVSGLDILNQAMATRAPRGSAPVLDWLGEIAIPANHGLLGKGIKVAVIDTGVDTRHPFLRGCLVPGIDLGNRDKDATDTIGHGTHTAGTVHAVVPSAKIMPVKIFSDVGYADDAVIAEAIDWAVAHSAKVISMSIGRYEDPLFPAPIMHAALERALQAGVVVVAAAGNSNALTADYIPANHAGVVAVGATHQGIRTFFSNYGASVAAPGWTIVSSVPGGQYAQMSGTSMACPMVAGAMAAVRARFPRLNPQAATLRLTGRDQAREWGDVSIAHLNVSAALGLQGPNVFGQVVNAMAGTWNGGNVRNALITHRGNVIGRTDKAGRFSLRLPVGLHKVDVAVPGMISLGPWGIDVQAGQTTRMVKPLLVAPIRTDGAASVIVMHNTFHAKFAGGYGLPLDAMPNPIGSWQSVDLVNEYGEPLRMPSWTTFPFSGPIRDGFGGDAHSASSHLILPGAPEWTVRVTREFVRIYDPGTDEFPSFGLKIGEAFGKSDSEVVVIHGNRIVTRIAPNSGDPNDLPQTVYGQTLPAWNVCRVKLTGGSVVVTPVNTITPPQDPTPPPGM